MSDVLSYKVNGLIHSWASSELLIGSAPFIGITEMGYGDKRTRAKVKGMNRSGVPLGVTSGDYDADPFTMKVLVKSFDILTTILTVKGLGSYGSAGVPITWKCFEPKSPPIIVIASDCYLTDKKLTASQGPDGLTYDVSFLVSSVSENGKVLYTRGPL